MKDKMLAAVVGGALLLGVGATAMIVGLRGSGNDAGGSAPSAIAQPVSQPPPRVVEDCNQYAASRDNSRVVRDGVVGGLLGAGAGAAAGAVVDKRHSVGRGAGIGALVGAAAGTLYGINEENKKTEAARAAYGECLARNGY